MNILYTDFLHGDGGGQATYGLSLARALHGQHHFHIAAPRDSRLLRTAEAEGIATPIALDFGSGLTTLPRQMAEQRLLRELVKRGSIDLIHVNGTRDHRFVMQALLGGQRPPILLTKHNSKSTRTLGNTLRARLVTDRVIAVSEYTHRLLKQGPYRDCPIDVILNGVDVSHFTPLPASAGQALRKQWTMDRDALVFVSNAGTDASKGWIHLVEAITRLPESIRTHVHVAVAGRAPPVQLHEQVIAMGMGRQVHFAGLLADTRPFIAAGDVGFVLSYESESISFACREMMASGKPVMTSNFAGLPENIRPGVDGWVMPVADVAAISAQVELLYRQRAELPLYGVAARSHAEAEFGISTFIALTEASYKAALAAG